MATVQTCTVELMPMPSEAPASPTNPLEAPQQSRRVFNVAPTATVGHSSRVLITTLLILANFVQFISNFVTFAGGVALSKSLGRDAGAGSDNWMAASYSLTQGAFVLITGRLGSVYGHQRLTLIGMFLFTVFSLGNGFCTSYDSFIALRALTGVGGGVFMPNAVSIITTTVPPGRSRNLLMGFFAASPPIGGMVGALLAAVFTQWAEWKYMFVLIAGCSGLLMAWLLYLMPAEHPVDRGGKIDYLGAFLGLSSLLLFNVVWNQAPSVGWQSPYEIACLLLSICLFCAFLVWEKRAAEPIMPLTIFRAPTFTALVFVVLLGYMGFGISLWYSISWQQQLRHQSVLQVALHFLPFGVGAVCAVALAAWLVPRVAAQWIMAVGVAVVAVASALLATMPVQQTYWAQLFPATLVSSFCPDLVYVAAQLIACNSVGRRQQGVASSLIGTLNLYGISLGLGFAGTIESELNKGRADPVFGYRAALWFGGALAVVGLLLDFAFVRVPRDQRETWDEPTEHDESDLGAVLGGAATAVQRPPLM